MNSGEVLIFSGTTEGRELSEILSEAQIYHTVCVATEYGKFIMSDSKYAKVLDRRLDEEEIVEFLKVNNFKIVCDATHPYATLVTKNIKNAVNKFGCKELNYFRLRRDTRFSNELTPSVGFDVDKKEKNIQENQLDIKYFNSVLECEKALEKTTGNILLTTGSKNLPEFTVDEKVKERLYVRVLPGVESIKICNEQQIAKNKIIAIQGPFSYEMNKFFIENYNIKILVTKESGIAGGFAEKIQAAVDSDCMAYVIGSPVEDEAYNFIQVCEHIQNILNVKLNFNKTVPLDISLIGIGPGKSEFLTEEAKEKINNADILIGASRMIEKYPAKIEKNPIYMPKDIVNYLKNISKKYVLKKKLNVSILFSGDIGFYSGCKAVRKAIENALSKKNDLQCLEGTIEVIPGISSVIYMAAKCGETWQDAKIQSIHGRKDKIFWQNEIVESILHNEKTFLIVSGVEDINKIGKIVTVIQNGGITVKFGYHLSYEDEEIAEISARDCILKSKKGLYVLLIKNSKVAPKIIGPKLKDSEFIRAKVPMTKEEVRHIIVNKLQLQKGDMMLDIGSGTGSIAIEAADLDENIRVFAIETKKEAVDLIQKNVEKFKRFNVKVISGMFPDVLDAKENEEIVEYIKENKVNSVFIGGTKGKFLEIIKALKKINFEEKNQTIENADSTTSPLVTSNELSAINVVTSAVTVESIAQITEVLNSDENIYDVDITQIQVSKAETLGKYHLFKGQNPIVLFAFKLKMEV